MIIIKSSRSKFQHKNVGILKDGVKKKIAHLLHQVDVYSTAQEHSDRAAETPWTTVELVRELWRTLPACRCSSANYGWVFSAAFIVTRPHPCLAADPCLLFLCTRVCSLFFISQFIFTPHLFYSYNLITAQANSISQAGITQSDGKVSCRRASFRFDTRDGSRSYWVRKLSTSKCWPVTACLVYHWKKRHLMLSTSFSKTATPIVVAQAVGDGNGAPSEHALFGRWHNSPPRSARFGVGVGSVRSFRSFVFGRCWWSWKDWKDTLIRVRRYLLPMSVMLTLF